MSMNVGMEKFDKSALSEYQQQQTNSKKINLRIENEKYLREHPEVSLLIQDFLKQSFLNKPENVREYAAHYFTNPKLNECLKNLLNENANKSEVNKMVQKLKVQDLNKI